MSRAAFLASLRPGTIVHLVTDIDGTETRRDVVVARVGARSFVVVLPDLSELRLDADGYRPRSTYARIVPSVGPADVANAAAATRAEVHRLATDRARAAS